MYGRCIPEILRTVEALQIADKYNVSTPANWVNGNPVIQEAPQTYDELIKRAEEIKEKRNGFSWYLSFKDISESKDEKRVEEAKNKEKEQKK